MAMSQGGLPWKFFLGSCILAGGLVLKFGAPLVPVVAGLALAALATWKIRGGANGQAR
jgi:hypothetical protein